MIVMEMNWSSRIRFCYEASDYDFLLFLESWLIRDYFDLLNTYSHVVPAVDLD